jgi:hypothetical protein
MWNKLKRAGFLALVLSAGVAVFQPTAAKAADWHDRDHHDRREFRDRDYRQDWRRDRDWRHDRDWRRDRDWDYRGRDRGYLYFNYSTAPNYYYAPAPSYPYGSAYPYGVDPNCPPY